MIVVLFKKELRSDADRDEYSKEVDRMLDLVGKMPGFVSIKSYTGEDGDQIELIRFKSEDALDAWRTHPEHVKNQERGRDSFYEFYSLEVCEVIRQYDFHRERGRRILIPTRRVE